jgi:predicted short-subunit dehydrogenase-like oxidoreductase (DUF2520 family)
MAWHLALALPTAGFPISRVYGRQLERAAEIVSEAGSGQATDSLDFSDDQARLFLMCVSDQALPIIAEKAVYPEKSVIAHTSGSQSLAVLERAGISIGVLYPLQTFTKGLPLNLREVPFLIEAKEQSAEELLFQIASSLSDKVKSADSQQRLQVHLAAVFSCNFTNHLLGIGKQLLSGAVSDESLLTPLIRQTIEKALTHNPFEVQTGPAIRNDQITLDKHLALLEAYPEWKEMYQNLSRSIQKSKPDATAH